MSVVRTSDGDRYIGRVVTSNCPRLEIEFEHPTELKENDQVVCKTGDGISAAIMQGVVMIVETGKASIWITVQTMSHGVDRAPRALASGIDVLLETETETISASLCDCSESGLRVSSLVNLSIEKTVKIHVLAYSEIVLTGQIVRAVQTLNSDYVEMGIAIQDAERVHRARWNHLVATLMEKYGMAA